MQRDQLLAGRYRLGERLGQGGMSVVHRAHDEVLERDVAVKVLVGSDAVARRRIRAEAKAAARMSHPNVTNVYDYGESPLAGERVPFVVMELLTGRTLEQRLADGPLPPRAALRVCAEVAAALAAAHALGLVHRDVKPGNVMLTATGAKVLDFGIAAVAGAPEIDFEGRLLGTPAYLAPERLDAGEVLPASDVYALGLLLHRVLVGRLPWQLASQTGALRAHAYAEPGPLPEVAGLPAEVGRLYRRCVAKDPLDRPAAAEVARVLAAAVVKMAEPDPAAPGRPAPDGADRPALRPPGAPAAGAGRPGRRATRLGGRLVLAVGTAVVAAVGLAGTLGDPSVRSTPGGGPRSGATTSGTAAVGLPVTADVEDEPAPGGGAPGGRASPAPASSAVPTPPARTPGTPTPTTGRPSPTGRPGVPVSARGGVVRVACDRQLVEVLDVAPAAGYQVEAYEPGPAREVRVEFVSADNRSVVTVRCANGRPVPRVKERTREAARPVAAPADRSRGAGPLAERSRRGR
ncbi:serine/threonine-protein kinase [Micromonospora sp. C28SCA-DRY-2]|uniref:serine/threonine-protein kinase n=1 Tax=Micromonospora sp. C28SCA-DRY-2 TaxID=3059522 RepID=UPI0026767DB5|nr:serine/threonine-protein kinase [Micromonospora sp. C28SCA-DRY-2]MDO3703777.1 serine/threonine-protein kinase [Micromonospora sp. C28SCA-DRY-2]